MSCEQTKHRLARHRRAAAWLTAVALACAGPAFAGTSITSVSIKDLPGNTITELAPTDTVYLDLRASNDAGFRNITQADIALSAGQFSSTATPGWQGASFHWGRASVPRWSVTLNDAAGWQVVESLCQVDTVTNSTSAQLIRFAVVIPAIARAGNQSWQVQAWVNSNTQRVKNYSMLEYVAWTPVDGSGAFAPARPGTYRLALTDPSTGELTARLVANTPVQLFGRASAFTGNTTSTVRFGGGTSDTTVFFSQVDSLGEHTGWLDSLDTSLGTTLSPQVDSAAKVVHLRLALGLPGSATVQTYGASLTLTQRSSSGNVHPSVVIPLEATALGSGLAASSATAEVGPTSVVAGTLAQSFVAKLAPVVGASETGVNRVRVGLPSAWSHPHVTAVNDLFGLPMSFHDASTATSAVAVLGSTVRGGLVRVSFTADAPTAADSAGSDFPVFFDDTTTTAVPEQVATAGNADLIGDSGWHVSVPPAAAAALDLTPVAPTLVVGGSVTFSAVVTDRFGNRRFDAVSWNSSGSAGSVDASGRFSATAPGIARVIARTTSVADTAFVTVTDPAAAVRFWADAAPADRLLPAGAPIPIFVLVVNNPGTLADTLDAIELTDVSSGPASQSQLRDEWASLELRDSTGARVAGGVWDGTYADFSRLELPLPATSQRRLTVWGGVTTHARDGDSLGFSAPLAKAITLRSTRAASLQAGVAPQRFAVDGMTAAQLTLKSGVRAPLLAGARRRAIGSLRVPGNGYAADRLLRLNLLNRGTASADTELTVIEAWADDGDGQLDTLTDARLGRLYFTGARWEITGLDVAVPDTGLVVHLSADIPTSARDGRTVLLAVPSLPDVGLGMASGNSGPIDAEVVADRENVIGGGDRVLVTSTPITGGTVAPGTKDVPMLALVFGNGYSTARHVESIVLTNQSAGAGNSAQMDAELSRVVLRLDATASGPVASTTLPIAVGSFSGGTVAFEGLHLSLPAGGQLRLTVTGDLSSAGAADGDHPAIALARSQDVEFDSLTTVGGTWPIGGGGTWTVDGFVATQALVHPVPGLTLAPLDGPVLALDLTLPSNGYLTDVLRAVRVTNLGNAAPAEIGALRLVRDGGDGRLGGSPSDDVDLGPLVRLGGLWQSAYLSETLPAGGRRYFVTLTVASATSDSSTVQLAVPANGVDMDSGDDGPLDGVLANPLPHVLSTRPLLASLALTPSSSTMGQQIDLQLTVRNVGSEALTGVAPSELVPEGSASYTIVSGPSPGPVSLARGADTTFAWTLATTSAGDLRFATGAAGTGSTSGLGRNSLVVHSNLHNVYTETDSLRLVALQSMPSAVNLGQTGVVPLTLTLEHPGDASSSDILFQRLRVRLEQEDGTPIVPSQLLAAVWVREGTTTYLHRTALETSGSIVDLPLATPARVSPGNPVSLALSLDLASAATVGDFRIVVDDSSVFQAADAISGAPVRLRLQGASYPIRSGLARLLSGGGSAVLALPAPSLRHASAGQTAVPVAAWNLSHSNASLFSADLRVNSVVARARLLAGTGGAAAPWTRWRVRVNGALVCERTGAIADTGGVRFDLSPAPVVRAGAPVDLTLESDLAADAVGHSFLLEAASTAQWEVRDVNSGELAPVVVSTPVGGDTVRIEAPATTLGVVPIALMPATVAAGRTRLRALDLVLHHPGAAGEARVELDSVRVSLLAPGGAPLDMAQYLDAIRLVDHGVTLDQRRTLDGSTVTLGARDTLVAGERDTVGVEIDLAGDSPAGSIELRIAAGGITACDANTNRGIVVAPEPPAAWPFGSGAATLVAPARELLVALRSDLPAFVADGGAAVPAARLVLHHPGPAGSGSILVDHLDVEAADDGGQGTAIGAVAASLDASVGVGVIASSGALGASQSAATLTFATPVEVPALDSVVIALALHPRAGGAVRFRVGVQSAGIGVVQPTSTLLAVAVLAEPGLRFPMWSEVAGFAAAKLDDSYTNFPNPFAAGRDATTFAFRMPAPGRATLRIWTPRGERVATLLDSEALPAGLRQSDRWDGRNGQGVTVANGVYVAELDVKLDDGRHERVLRKVAVVR